MSRRNRAIIGTTEEAIAPAETEVGFRFPPSFRAWLLENNGSQPDGVRKIYPAYDGRDSRRTSISLTRNYQVGWARWRETLAGDDSPPSFEHLFPFAECAGGDYYCFDFDRRLPNGEAPVVLWSHDEGKLFERAATFAEFMEKAARGDYEGD